MIRIAVDAHISDHTIKILRNNGFEVCYKAPPGISDEEWFEECIKSYKCNFIISNDKKVIRFSKRLNLKFVDPRPEIVHTKKTRSETSSFILNEVIKLVSK